MEGSEPVKKRAQNRAADAARLSAAEREDLRRTLVERLEEVDDLDLETDVPLASKTTLRIGGPADLLVTASSEEGVVRLLEALAVVGEQLGASVPFHHLGQGSNVLFPDDGMPGVVLRLAGELSEYHLDEERRLVTAGGGMSLAQLAMRMAKRGFTGLEALAGFPSSVGGAVYMNAGCYGVEIKDVLESAIVVVVGGERRVLGVPDLAARYRSTALEGSGSVVTSATFRLASGDAEKAVARIRELNEKRWSSLPSGKPNAGSTFRNPEGDYAGRLIEVAGLKGARVGGAQVSEKHANVLQNVDHARAADVVRLLRRVRRTVLETSGVELVPELVLAGHLARDFWRDADEEDDARAPSS